MGGGCQSPVAAFAEVLEQQISMRAVSFHQTQAKHVTGSCSLEEAMALGASLAEQLS